MIGIPYARVEVTLDGRLVEVCPVCGVGNVATADETGEMVQSTYAAHYAACHSA